MKKITTLFLLLSITMCLHAQSWKYDYIKERIEAGDYTAAAKDLRPLAEKGDAEAQYLAAGLFRAGKGVIKSDEQAEKYYLLSAKQGYMPAIIGLADFYEERKLYDKEFKLLQSACENDEKQLNSDIGFVLGRLLFEGKGVEQDIERGWETMYTASTQTKSEEYDAYMKEHHMQFFKFYIDKYATASNEDKFVGLFSKKYCIADWHDEIMEAVISKIAVIDHALQEKLLNRFKSVQPLDVASCYFMARMYYHGYGVSANLAAAKKYAKALVKYYATYPIMSKNLEPILYNYYAGETVLGVGEVDYVEGDSVTLKTGNARKYTLSKTDLFQREEKARVERLEREQRKQNMKAVSLCPQILAGKPFATYKAGTLEVTIPISLKAMNKCSLTADEAKYKDESGKWRTASCHVVGLKAVGTYSNCLMPRETAYLTITIKGVRSRGELSQVSAKLHCNYGVGTVTVADVIW